MQLLSRARDVVGKRWPLFVIPLGALSLAGAIVSGGLFGIQWEAYRDPQEVPDDLCQPVQREPGGLEGGRSPTEMHGVSFVAYEARPEAGGSSARRVYADGAVEGHHMSGAPGAPMVSMERGTVSRACVGAVWTVAQRISKTAADRNNPSPGSGTASIVIGTGSDRQVVTSWPHGTAPSDTDLQVLRRLLSEMEIGYW